MGNNASTTVLGIGTCKLELRGGRTLYLHDVLYALEVRRNLISIVVLLELDFSIMFEYGCVKVFLDKIDYDSRYLLNGFMVLDIVYVFVNDDTSIYIVGNSSSSNDNDSVIWHARLEHIEQDRLKRLARAGLLGSLAKIKLPICKHCFAGKVTRLPFGKAKRATSKLQLIHLDICGPMNVRARYAISSYLYMISHALVMFI